MNTEDTIKTVMDMPVENAIMLKGKHGIGKSSVVKLAGKLLEERDGVPYTVHDVRLSQCEVGDIKGLPYLNAATKTTDFFKPYWWPRNPDSHGILFLDELNRASKDVLQAVFELCLDRRLDGETLPKGWRVVTAINSGGDYDVIEMDPALLDRWFQVEFAPTHKEWINWGYDNDIHASILTFIEQNKNLLDPPDEVKDQGDVTPSRRSWEKLSRTLENMDLFESGDSKEGYLTQICKGFVGTTVAMMYVKFLLKEYSRISPEKILNDLHKDKGIQKELKKAQLDIEAVTALASSVGAYIKGGAKLDAQQIENLKLFIVSINKDVASMLWKEILAVQAIKKASLTWMGDTSPEAKAFREHISSLFVAPKK